MDSSADGSLGVEVNDMDGDTLESTPRHDDAIAVDATHIDVQQSVPMTDEILGDDDDDMDAASNVAFATTLLNEQLEKISLPDLESTLYVFRQVLEGSAPGQGLHSDAIRGLIFATGLKYICKKDEETMLELIQLKELLDEPNSMTETSNPVVEDDELRDMLTLGQATWDELRGSISSTTVNTIVCLLRQSLDEIPSHDERWTAAFATFSYATYLQFHHCKVSSDLMTVLSMLEHALRGDQPRKLRHLAQIGIFLTVTLLVAGEHGSGPSRNAGVSGASPLIPDQSAAMGHGPHAEDLSLFEHGTSLLRSVEANGDMDDLESCIEMLRLGLTEIPFANPQYTAGLNNLAAAIHTRFEHRGNPQNLDESISLYRRVLDLRPSPHPLRSRSLNNLAVGLSTRFEQRGDPHDLDESITLYRQALELFPSHHPDRSTSLNNLAVGLSTRFEQRGDPHDLDDSITLDRQALELFPSPHPCRSGSLNNLATGLSTRFEQRGDPHDLDESITLHRQALELFPSPHPLRSMSLNNLANGLSTRFEQRGDPHDLDESITLQRQALDLCPSPHPDRSMLLNNLANRLSTRFEQRGDPHDLDESITLHRQALELFPSPHPLRSRSLNNLANGLSTRFEQQSDPHDLDESITLQRQALDLCPSPHPLRSMSLNNLANGLFTRFEQQGDPHDFDESITLHRQALDLRPFPHPLRSISLNNLANGLFTQFEQQDNPHDLDCALKHISEAANSTSASPSNRYKYARRWALRANQYHHSSALQAFDLALSLIPQLVALGLDIQARQDTLSRHADRLVGQAAQCAINLGDLPMAVEFLETGRSVFWSQFLSLRSPLDKLKEISSVLAEDLHSISQQLERGSHRDQNSRTLSNREKFTLEAEANNYTKLAQDWDSKITEIRRLDGFQDFLRPKQFSALQAAAEGGPVIYLVDSEPASHGLVITASDVHDISLPELPSHRLAGLVDLVKAASSGCYTPSLAIQVIMKNLAHDFHLVSNVRELTDDGDRAAERFKLAQIPSDDIFRLILHVLWDGVVKPVIDDLSLTKSDNPGKIIWCTTGLFNFLPIHAAGHSNEGKFECAPEYFISTYTPTIEALLTPDPPSSKSFQMMAVIQSEENLPSTHEELKRIQRYVPDSILKTFGIPGNPATVKSVASELSTASLVHFACHGKQDSANPLQSGLKIGGEQLTIARMMRESVPNGSLAFLSACETATGDAKIPDEAMNIASSMLFTGFRKVVATMWRMWDADGPVIADAFYRELFTGPDGGHLEVPDTSKSAKALWVAVNELRSKGVEFRRWVPFIHMGK